MSVNIQIAEVLPLEQALSDCSKICRSLTESGAFEVMRDHGLPDLTKLARQVNDCAASCDIAVLLIERKSHIVADFLQVCEEHAMECAWECSKYGLELFKACSKACSKACEQVAKMCLPYITQE